MAEGRDGGGLVLKAVIRTAAVRRVERQSVIELADVARAGPVSGPEGFARRQRKPAQGGPWRAARARPPVIVRAAVAADKGDQRRGVHRARWQASRHPGPARANLRPASVVKRRKAPRRVIDPGPAPRGDPAPVAGAVGRPVQRQGARQPDGAIDGVLLPVAVAVELLVANGFARHIAGRERLVFARIAVGGPQVKGVLHGGARCGGAQVGAGKAALLRAAYRQRHAVAAVNDAAARLRHHPRGVAGRADIEPVIARLGHHERQVGRVDFQALAVQQAAHPQLQRALRQPQLGCAVVQRHQIEAGFFVHPHRR